MFRDKMLQVFRWYSEMTRCFQWPNSQFHFKTTESNWIKNLYQQSQSGTLFKQHFSITLTTAQLAISANWYQILCQNLQCRFFLISIEKIFAFWLKTKNFFNKNDDLRAKSWEKYPNSSQCFHTARLSLSVWLE